MQGIKVKTKDKVHGCYYLDDNLYGMVFNYSEDTGGFALYNNETKETHLIHNTLKLFEYLYSLNFNIGFPEGTTTDLI